MVQQNKQFVIKYIKFSVIRNITVSTALTVAVTCWRNSACWVGTWNDNTITSCSFQQQYLCTLTVDLHVQCVVNVCVQIYDWLAVKLTNWGMYSVLTPVVSLTASLRCIEDMLDVRC